MSVLLVYNLSDLNICISVLVNVNFYKIHLILAQVKLLGVCHTCTVFTENYGQL